jgi:hypothetical protein
MRQLLRSTARDDDFGGPVGLHEFHRDTMNMLSFMGTAPQMESTIQCTRTDARATRPDRKYADIMMASLLHRVIIRESTP